MIPRLHLVRNTGSRSDTTEIVPPSLREQALLIPSWVLARPELSYGDMLVYSSLLYCACQDDGRAAVDVFPGKLAELTGLSRQSVWNSLTRLRRDPDKPWLIQWKAAPGVGRDVFFLDPLSGDSISVLGRWRYDGIYLPVLVAQDKQLQPRAKLFYAHLRRIEKLFGAVYSSQQQLAEDFGAPISKIRDYTQRLHAKGLLIINERRHDHAPKSKRTNVLTTQLPSQIPTINTKSRRAWVLGRVSAKKRAAAHKAAK